MTRHRIVQLPQCNIRDFFPPSYGPTTAETHWLWRFRESCSSVSMSCKSTKLKKSSRYWLTAFEWKDAISGFLFCQVVQKH